MTIDKIMPSQQVTWSQDYRLWLKLTLRWSSAVEWPCGALFQYDNGLFTPQMWTRQDSFVWSPIVFTPPTRQFCHVSTQFRWVLSCLCRWCEHNWRRDKTVLSSRVGGVNTIGDKTRQFCLVSNCVHTTDADQTKQFCLIRVSGVNKPLETVEEVSLSQVQHCEAPCHENSRPIIDIYSVLHTLTTLFCRAYGTLA